MLDAGADVRKVFKEVRFAGSYSQALSALLQGSADVAAVSFYALESEGSPHIAPEQAKLLRVVERIPGVPTHVIAVRSGLTEALKEELANAFVELGKSSPELLKDLYGASRFVKVDSAVHVKASEQAIAVLGIPLDSIVGR
jgi:ABC-type phosphate/phosphonate transport system substrate-binding protein